MGKISRATALAIALAMSACGQPASTPSEASSGDLELGAIETTASDLTDNTVTVELRWTFRQLASSPTNVAELPPVFLSNGPSDIRAVPDARPTWHNGEIRFEATVHVPKEQWRQGCWQADYRLTGVVASGRITCINQGA